MALTEARPLALPSGEGDTNQRPAGVFARPTASTGWRSWVTTVDHKKIGIMYGATALVFLLIGGFEALLIRLQLWAPNGTLLSADVYNQVYTMHGTTMVFLVVMPIGAAFANYLMPLQIGARDVAFPRINAFSYWVLRSSAASSSTPAGCWAAAPTAAGSTTPRTTASSSPRATASTSGTSASSSPASPRSPVRST